MKTYCNKHYAFYDNSQGCADCHPGGYYLKPIDPDHGFITLTTKAFGSGSIYFNGLKDPTKMAKLKDNSCFKLPNTIKSIGFEALRYLIRIDGFDNKVAAEEIYQDWLLYYSVNGP